MTTSSISSDGTAKRQDAEPRDGEWESFKSKIIDLYITKNLKLADVQDTLRNEDGFHSSLPAFKRKLREWRVEKYISSEDMDRITQSLLKTHSPLLTSRAPDQELSVDGQIVKLAAVKRHMRRKKNTDLVTESSKPRCRRCWELKKACVPMERDWFTEGERCLECQRSDVPCGPPEALSGHIEEPANPPCDQNEPQDFRGGAAANTINNSQPHTVNPATQPPLTGIAESSMLVLDLSKPNREGTDTSTSSRLSCHSGDSSYISALVESHTKRRRVESLQRTESEAHFKLFACPYAKYDPQRYSERNAQEKQYRLCRSCYLADIPRLKQHLYRIHRRPGHLCPRCFSQFKSSELLNVHLRSEKCQLTENPFSEKMTDDQFLLIKRRDPGRTPTDMWYLIYRTLFPGEPQPLSPYANTSEPNSVELDSSLNFLETEGLPTLSRTFEAKLDSVSINKEQKRLIMLSLADAAKETMLTLRHNTRSSTVTARPSSPLTFSNPDDWDGLFQLGLDDFMQSPVEQPFDRFGF